VPAWVFLGTSCAVEEERRGGCGRFFESELAFADELDGGGEQAAEQLVDDFGWKVVAEDSLADSPG